MPAEFGIAVKGLRDLNRAFAHADKDARKQVRAAEKQVAEPVRVDAEQLAVTNISHIGQRWSQMRIGVTTRVIYVAPKSRRRGGSPRKNLAGLLMGKAMEPALERNRHRIESDIEHALDSIADNFNRGAL